MATVNNSEEFFSQMFKNHADKFSKEGECFSNLLWNLVCGGRYSDKIICFVATPGLDEGDICIGIVEWNTPGLFNTMVKMSDVYEEMSEAMDAISGLNRDLFGIHEELEALILNSAETQTRLDRAGRWQIWDKDGLPVFSSRSLDRVYEKAFMMGWVSEPGKKLYDRVDRKEIPLSDLADFISKSKSFII